MRLPTAMRYGSFLHSKQITKMKHYVYTFLILLGIGHAVQAQSFLPTAFPDRVVLNWQTDPTQSQAVTWRTDTSVVAAIAQISIAKDGPDLEVDAQTYEAITTFSLIKEVAANYHSVNFTGLKPETMYAYRVGSEKGWSEWFQFTTASTEAKPFSFVYFGDAQNDLKSMWSRVVRQAYSDMPKASFMLHAGDLINRTDSDTDWGEWFYAGSFIHATIPCMPTPGNHEYTRDENRVLQIDQHWQPTFTLPDNGPEGLKESVYYTDLQGVRIISINSQMAILDEKSGKLQAKWLEEVLQDNPNKWTFVTFHHPIYSAKDGRDNEGFRKLIKPLLDQYKVDLVLQGHDHTYGRGMNLPNGVSDKDEQSGTMYVVSVSGPKMYELTLDKWMDRAASNTQLYQIITVDNNTVTFEAYTTTGKLYDAFDLVKSEKGPNKLINRIPETPERTDLPPRYKKEYTEDELKRYYQVYPQG